MYGIADIDGVPDPINDRTKRFAMVIGREMTGKILASIYFNPYQSASEIARYFNIHIATAQKYLVEMRECGLLESRLRRSSNRPTEEYWLTSKRFDIEIDLENMPKLADLEMKAANTFIRQKQSVQIAFDTHRSNQIITEIILLDSKERSRIDRRIKLDEIEGRFVWYLPSPEEPSASVLELVKKAELPLTDLPRIMDLVDKLANMELDDSRGLIGIIEKNGGDEQ